MDVKPGLISINKGKDAGVRVSLASARMGVGDVPGAKEALRKAVELNPSVKHLIRSLADFDDLDETESQLRRQLEAEATDAGRAEVLTQLARVEGLRGEFARGDALIQEATAPAGGNEVAGARIDLELGRLRRSSGDADSAHPLFESAYASALTAGQYFMAADAAHMAALVAGDREGVVDWTSRGLELAETREPAAYWAGPLLNNLGWEYYEAGDYERALDAFERALTARQRTPENAEPIALARYAVG